LANYSRVTDALHGGTANPKYQDAASVRPRLRYAVVLSLFDIGLCFVALPFTHVIAPHATPAVGILAVAVVAGVACLVLYWRLISLMISLAG
jgi:hypothetical protein